MHSEGAVGQHFLHGGFRPIAVIRVEGDGQAVTPFAHAMLILFIIAWFVAVGGWFYGTRFFLPMWANGFQKAASREGYGRKALKGYAVFVCAVVFGFAVVGLAQLAGGWGQ